MSRRMMLLFIFMMGAGCCACEKTQQAAQTPPTMLYTPLKSEKVELKRIYPARVAAAAMAEVRPQAGGILMERLFEEGDEVRSGQILYRIDPAPFRAAYEEAKALLTKAEAREKAARRHMERCINLARNNAVPVRERDDAIAAYNEVEAEIKAAREQLKKASIELGHTEITAPISGKIGRSLVLEGSLVTSSQEKPLAVINQVAPVYIDVALPVRDMLALRNDAHEKDRKQLAEVRLKDTPGHGTATPSPARCEILFSETTADEDTGTVNLRLSCPNKAQTLMPGMYVRASLPIATMDQAIRIPKRSVARDNRNRPIVYVLEQGEGEDMFTLEERLVDLAMEDGNSWIVSDGLREGDLLLVEGLQKARNNMVVKGREKSK